MDQASSVKCPWYHGFPEFLPRFENSRSDNTFIETPGNRKRVDLSCRLLILSCYSRGCQRAIENGATGALKTGFQRWVIDFSTKVFQILMIAMAASRLLVTVAGSRAPPHADMGLSLLRVF